MKAVYFPRIYYRKKCKRNKFNVRFEVPTGMTMEIAVFWDVMPCSLIDRNVSKEPTASIFKVEDYVEITVFWDMWLCSLIDSWKRFG
jgi:hypothetical protein